MFIQRIYSVIFGLDGHCRTLRNASRPTRIEREHSFLAKQNMCQFVLKGFQVPFRNMDFSKPRLRDRSDTCPDRLEHRIARRIEINANWFWVVVQCKTSFDIVEIPTDVPLDLFLFIGRQRTGCVINRTIRKRFQRVLKSMFDRIVRARYLQRIVKPEQSKCKDTRNDEPHFWLSWKYNFVA